MTVNRTRTRCAVVAMIVTLASVMTAPTAMAGVDHWFQGSLSKDFAYASVSAHSATYVQANAYNDLICSGLEQGVAGSYYDAPFFSDCDNYSVNGTAAGYYSPVCCFHATVIYGGPAAAKQILSATHYDW